MTLTYLDDTWLAQEKTQLERLQQQLTTAAHLLTGLAEHAPEVAERLQELDQRWAHFNAALDAQAAQHRQALLEQGGAARADLDAHLRHVIADLGKLSEAGLLLEAQQGIQELRGHVHTLESARAETRRELEQLQQARKMLDQQGEHLTEELERLELEFGSHPAALQEAIEQHSQAEAALRQQNFQDLQERIDGEAAERTALSALLTRWRTEVDAVQAIQNDHQVKQQAFTNQLFLISKQLAHAQTELDELRSEHRAFAVAQQTHAEHLAAQVATLRGELTARVSPLDEAQKRIEHDLVETQAISDALRHDVHSLQTENDALIARLTTEENRTSALRTELTSIFRDGLAQSHKEQQASVEELKITVQNLEARWNERQNSTAAGLDDQRARLRDIEVAQTAALKPIEAKLGVLRRNVDEVDRQTRSTNERLQKFLGWFNAANALARLRGNSE